MEYANGGSLEKEMKNVDPKEVRSIITQILIGLEYIHKKDIIHRDIKPPNILIQTYANSPLKVYKIADFGVSKIVGKRFIDTNKTAVSYPWAPLEQIYGKPASKAYDIWATGVIFYQLLSYGRLPYDIKS